MYLESKRAKSHIILLFQFYVHGNILLRDYDSYIAQVLYSNVYLLQRTLYLYKPCARNTVKSRVESTLCTDQMLVGLECIISINSKLVLLDGMALINTVAPLFIPFRS